MFSSLDGHKSKVHSWTGIAETSKNFAGRYSWNKALQASAAVWESRSKQRSRTLPANQQQAILIRGTNLFKRISRCWTYQYLTMCPPNSLGSLQSVPDGTSVSLSHSQNVRVSSLHDMGPAADTQACYEFLEATLAKIHPKNTMNVLIGIFPCCHKWKTLSDSDLLHLKTHA